MKRIKFIGIGAVILMINLTMTPMVDSESLETSEKSDEGFFKGNWDLSLEWVNCEYSHTNSDPINDYAVYQLEFEVKNVGTEGFEGILELEIETLCENPTYRTIKFFGYIWNLAPGQSEIKIGNMNIISSSDPEKDKERHIAGYSISVELVVKDPYDDPNPINNVNEDLFVKYWKDEESYEPTDPQVEVSTPHIYRNVSVGRGLWYFEIFDPDELAIVLKNNRMGYTYEIAVFFSEICTIFADLIELTIDFCLLVKDDYKLIHYWLETFFIWFLSVINGDPIEFGFITLLLDFIKYVHPAIYRILDAAKEYGNKVIIIITEELWEIINDIKDWTEEEPWKRPITIEGRIENVHPEDLITISCRDYSEKWTDVSDGKADRAIEFSFEVSSEPMFKEKYYWWIHDCTVNCYSHYYEKNYKSKEIFSWAFSDGKMRILRPISINFINKATSSNNDVLILEKNLNRLIFIKCLFKDISSVPIFNSLKNIQSFKGNMNREFNLDEFNKRVLEKHRNQSPYKGLEYKKYFHNAPRISNVVYYRADQVIVGFKSHVDVTELEDVEGYPIVDKVAELNVAIVEIFGIDPEEFIENLENNKDVEYAELNYVYNTCFEPNDPHWIDQWGPKKINCPDAWDIQKGYIDIDISIIDTGCNYNHEDIGCKESHINYDFVNNDNDPMDDFYIKHGTHCAGIIGATMNNKKGISGIAEVFTSYIKVLDENGAGFSNIVAKGIIHAAKDINDAEIISMSLGGYGPSILIRAACEYAYAIKKVLIIAAAGNDGVSRCCYPARYDSVLSVGAVDENLELCSWSNYGPDLDLVAPGEDILSTVGGNSYKRLSGTSMACPHVAGVAGLYYSQFSALASPILCKSKLFSSAIDLGSPGKDWKYGYGLVNAYGVVKTRIGAFQQMIKQLHRMHDIFEKLSIMNN